MATLSFKGKSFVQNYYLAVKYHELIPIKQKSLTDNVSLKDNLVIHGDNLNALKALLPTYAGKIKCIYIDPPFNTGNENWVYNDNVNSPMMQDWLGKVVDKDDLTKHDKWLCMMTPRLRLLRELLREDGVILVSIDDNEVARLTMLMDEVFQEQNHIATLAWQRNSGGGNDTSHIAVSHEYVLCYAKNINEPSFRILNDPPTQSMLKTYNLEDEYVATRGKHDLRNLNDFSIGDRPGLHYDIECPDGTFLDGDEHRWRCDETTYKRRLNEGRIVFQKNDDDEWEVLWKIYINEQKGELLLDEDGTILSLGRKPNTLLYKLVFTGDGKKDLTSIFGFCPFSYPKPVKLVKYLLSMVCKKNDIVLDSFAGSGTTGQAVLELNRNDGGHRRFILIQMPETIKQKIYVDRTTGKEVDRPKRGQTTSKLVEKPFTTKDGTELREIADIIEHRLKQLIRSWDGKRASNSDHKMSFSYLTLGEPIEMETILEGTRLPTYLDLARYIFYTATGEEFLPGQVDQDRHFIGESKEYEVYLFYKPDLDYLKSTALTLEVAKTLGDHTGKKKLVFAPTKYLDLNDSDLLAKHGLKDIEYCQLPFEIYRLKE